MYKPSKNPVVEEFTKSYKGRSINLTVLMAIKLPELNEKGKNRKKCAWCTEEEIFYPTQKYCSQRCSDSAMAWAYPQKENAILFMMLRQQFKCDGCQYDWKPQLDAVIERQRRRSPTLAIDLTWYHMKNLKAVVPSDKKPEVDHIIPISKGGTALGLENHHVICSQCHKKKTKIDNSGPRPNKKA